MDSSDEEAVRRAIEEDRQCVSKAKAAWEQAPPVERVQTHAGLVCQLLF